MQGVQTPLKSRRIIGLLSVSE